MKNNFKNKIKMDTKVKIDFNYCLARRNQNSLYNMQCPHLKKHGDFCGKHKNYLNKKLIPINVSDNQEDINEYYGEVKQDINDYPLDKLKIYPFFFIFVKKSELIIA